MKPLLFDEGLPPSVPAALRDLSIDAYAVGGEDAPPRAKGDGGDETNVAWCRKRNAILVTNDRGRRDKVIIDLLAEQHVDAIFVGKELRDSPAHRLAAAILNAMGGIDQQLSRKQLIKHHLTKSGRLKRKD